MSVVATLTAELATPLEAEALSPDVICELAHAEILALPVFLGNRQRRLGDFFEVDGEKSASLELYGDLAQVKWIGRGMTQGSIAIHGRAGMHLGASMSGGTITVEGDAADWLGAEMSGGLIHVRGRAGGQVGAAYRGSTVGMRSGEILIDGDAGIEVGMRMLARTHQYRRSGRRLRRLADEGWHPVPPRQGGNPRRRMDGQGNDRRL